ncbi:MAG: hypothetical protein EHM58_01095 [Ignavibacteriae bacterium]|nr:MAG: hypothetical protein EHM58_01095 [Ignavibacteriota bacterium]
MKQILLPLLPVIIFILFFNSCGEDTTTQPPVDPGTGNGTTKSFTTTEEGTIDFDNFEVTVKKGTVPRLQNNNVGTVVFSVNTSQSIPAGLPALPSGFTQVSKFITVGPDAFTFNSTVRISLPAGNEASPGPLRVLSYFPGTNDWRIVSTSWVDTANKRIAVDVLKLGYFVLTNYSGADHSLVPDGGVQYCTNDGLTFIILTIKSASFADPGVYNLYPDGLVGRTFVSPNIPGMVFPSDYCRGILPLGTYEFWVSSRNFDSEQIYTWSIPAVVTISNSLNWPLGWIYSIADGWTLFCAPTGGQWVLGRPSTWPPPTIPFGSGTFQGTLTWHNEVGSETDLDLHLYGPNNIHVYYASRISADSSFSLDRDWQSTVGDAIENIYSLKSTLPAGDYILKAVFYSGSSPKNYNARVILNGVSSTYSGSLSAGNEVSIKTFKIQ